MNSIASKSYRVLILCASLVAILLAGCGGEGGETKSDDGKIVVTFWHFWSEPAQKEALLKRIAAFEEKNPDVRVELSELSWNDGQTKLQLAFNSNTAPDVLELGSDWIAQFSSEGKLADQSKIGADKIDRFSPQILAPGQWKGVVYAWPWVVDTRVLYYNKTLLASIGADTAKVDTLWSDVLDRAEQIRAKNPEAFGFGANGPDRHRLYKKIIPFFWSNNGEVFNADGRPAINSPQNVEALEMYLALTRTGLFETQKFLDQSFVQGSVGYWISGPWLADRIAKDNPGLRYGVAMLPKFPGGASVSFGGGEYLAINNASPRKEQAKRLITFLTSAEQALDFAKSIPGGMTPADLSVAADPFLQGPVRKVFTEQMKLARMTPVHPKWLDIEEIIESEVAEAMYGNKEPAKALDDAQYRMTQLATNGGASGDAEAE